MATVNREFWVLPIFAGISLTYAAWLMEPVLWFLMYLCLACMILAVAYRWRNWQLITVARTFRTKNYIMEAGANLLVVLRAETSSLLPWPWLELRDSLPRTLEKNITGVSGGHMVWARKGAVQHTSYMLKNLPRGVHTWDTVSINSGDPLGLITYQGRVKMPGQIVVYPRTVELQARYFFPRRAEGSAMARKTLTQGLTQLVGVRDYRPGDRLSLIHWKSTAKTNQLYSKEFEPLLMNSSLVVLDCSADAWKPGHDPAFEEAVSVAASLIKAALLQRIPARFHSNHGKRHEQLAVASQTEYFQMLLLMASIAPTGRRLLSQSLYRELFVQDSNVIIVSSGQGEEMTDILYRLSARGNSVTVIRVNGHTDSTQPRAPGAMNVLNITKAEELNPLLKKDVN